eukprot:scaffold1493_cov66-Phaeocystis_antarctica.AAC.6
MPLRLRPFILRRPSVISNSRPRLIPAPFGTPSVCELPDFEASSLEWSVSSQPVSRKAVPCAAAPPRLCPEKMIRLTVLRSSSNSLRSATRIAAKCPSVRFAKPRCMRGCHGRSIEAAACKRDVPQLSDLGRSGRARGEHGISRSADGVGPKFEWRSVTAHGHD